MLGYFPVRLCLWIDSAELFQRVGTQFPTAPIIDGCGQHQFETEIASSAEELMALLQTQRETTQAFVVISDQLVDCSGPSFRATDFANKLRDWFNHEDQRGIVGGLVGLVAGPCQRTNDIAGMVDVRQDSLDERTRSEVRRVSDGLWLKSKIASLQDRSEADAVLVQVAQSQEQMEQALRLRFQVYNALGYLDPNLSACGAEREASNKSPLEVDQFDKSALHFVAIDKVTDDVVGTVRLICDVGRSPFSRIRDQQRAWLTSSPVVEEPLLRERYFSNPSTPFPLLENSDFGERWPDFLEQFPAQEGGELSRLVVSPRYRGLGISTLLIRMVTAVAAELHKDFIALECVPQHLRMYQGHGFESLGNHCRAQELDQIAVGMTLCLKPSFFNEPLMLADKDRRMLDYTIKNGQRRQAILCQCKAKDCWVQGNYRERGKDVCPLRREIASLYQRSRN